MHRQLLRPRASCSSSGDTPRKAQGDRSANNRDKRQSRKRWPHYFKKKSQVRSECAGHGFPGLAKPGGGRARATWACTLPARNDRDISLISIDLHRMAARQCEPGRQCDRCGERGEADEDPVGREPLGERQSGRFRAPSATTVSSRDCRSRLARRFIPRRWTSQRTRKPKPCSSQARHATAFQRGFHHGADGRHGLRRQDGELDRLADDLGPIAGGNPQGQRLFGRSWGSSGDPAGRFVQGRATREAPRRPTSAECHGPR